MKILIAILTLGLLGVHTEAEAQSRQGEVRARVVDQNGNTRYDLPSVRIEQNGRARVVDRNGNTRYDLPSVKVDQNGRRRIVDRNGNTRYDLPSVQTGRPRQ